MAERATLEEVGTAEDVLRRLVQERRLLENAASVLETYRVVLSQLEPAQAELAGVERKIGVAKQQFDGVERERVEALRKVEEEVKGYKEHLLGEVNREIEAVRETLGSLQESEREKGREFERLEKHYQEELKRYEGEVEVMKKELERLKKEHGTLVDAIGRAARAVHS